MDPESLTIARARRRVAEIRAAGRTPSPPTGPWDVGYTAAGKVWVTVETIFGPASAGWLRRLLFRTQAGEAAAMMGRELTPGEARALAAALEQFARFAEEAEAQRAGLGLLYLCRADGRATSVSTRAVVADRVDVPPRVLVEPMVERWPRAPREGWPEPAWYDEKTGEPIERLPRRRFWRFRPHRGRV